MSGMVEACLVDAAKALKSISEGGDPPTRGEAILLLSRINDALSLGPTSPAHEDVGPLRMAVGTTSNRDAVYMDFGVPRAWVTLLPDDAMRVAKMLVEHAMCVRGELPEGP